MARWFRNSSIVVAMLVAGWLLAVTTEWLPLLSAEQQQQVDVLTTRRPRPTGNDGFPLLWTLGYEVPDAELAGVIERDRIVIERQPGWVEHPPKDLAATDYPARVEIYSGGFCCRPSRDWLVDMQLHAQEVTDFVAAHPALFAALKRLEQADVVWDPFPQRLAGSYPSLQLLRYRPIAIAAAFRAAPQRAMTELCGHIGFLRRLRDGNNLIFTGIGDAFGRDSLNLLAQMRAQRPEQALPMACAAALTPLGDPELDLCAEIQGQFEILMALYASMDDLIGHDGSPFKRAYAWAVAGALLNQRHTMAGMAAQYAPHCEAGNRRDPLSGSGDAEACSWHEWPFNPMGCTLLRTETSGWGRYHRRGLDLDRALRLLALSDWLAGQWPQHQALLLAPPSHLGIADAELAFDPHTQRLRIDTLDTTKAAFWEIAVPDPTRLQPSAH